MMNPAYDGDLITQIREEYGTKRAATTGATETTGALQEQLRSSVAESRGPSEVIGGSNNGASPGDAGASGTKPTAKRSDRGKGRTSTTVNKGHSRDNGSDGSTHNQIPTATIKDKIAALFHGNPAISESEVSRQVPCSPMTARKYLRQLKAEEIQDDQEKPSGINPTPNAIERKIRQEQQQEEQRAAEQEQQRRNLFAWIKPGRKIEKPGGDKEPLRAKPLTDREAEQLRPALLAALLDYFKYADELIYATNRAHHHVRIWSSIDDEDAGVLVDVWLARAKTSVRSASHIVFMINKHAELRVGIILIPRFYETFRAYVDGGGIGVR